MLPRNLNSTLLNTPTGAQQEIDEVGYLPLDDLGATILFTLSALAKSAAVLLTRFPG